MQIIDNKLVRVCIAAMFDQMWIIGWQFRVGVFNFGRIRTWPNEDSQD